MWTEKEEECSVMWGAEQRWPLSKEVSIHYRLRLHRTANMVARTLKRSRLFLGFVVFGGLNLVCLVGREKLAEGMAHDALLLPQLRAPEVSPTPTFITPPLYPQPRTCQLLAAHSGA